MVRLFVCVPTETDAVALYVAKQFLTQEGSNYGQIVGVKKHVNNYFDIPLDR